MTLEATAEQQRARQLLAMGMQHHAEGRLGEAGELYAQAFALDPEQADAAHYAGIAALQRGCSPSGARWIKAAVAARPAFADALSNLSGALMDAKDYRGAADCCRRALRLAPDAPHTLNNLGQALQMQGDFAGAAACYVAALRRVPGFVEAENNLAAAFMRMADAYEAQGGLSDAINALRRALALQPSRTAAANQIVRLLDRWGEALRCAGDFAAAAACFEAILRLAPGVSEARYHLSLTREAQGRREAAEELLRETLRRDPTSTYARMALARHLRTKDGGRAESRALTRRALALNPADDDALNHLGIETLDDGAPELGAVWWRRALKAGASGATVYSNLGLALHAGGRVEPARRCYQLALAQDPSHAVANWNEGLARLLLGDYARGWALYEWRWRLPGVEDVVRPEPQWRGEELAGKNILVYAEQGFGDSIQFSRYAEELQALGARVTLLCQPPLVRLFQRLPGAARVVGRTEDAPLCAYRAPLLSLPRLLNTTLETAPARIPYLSADPALCAAWRGRLGAAMGRRKIGLVWRSNTRNARARTLTPADLAPLLAVKNVHFFGLVKDAPPGDLAALAESGAFTDLADRLSDFAETAAVMANLDLVISVDTACLHLSAALGAPTWAALHFAGEWRWGEGDRTPWYPDLRFFRQPAPGDWAPTVRDMIAALTSGAGLSP